jgi:elongator complex protein 1
MLTCLVSLKLTPLRIANVPPPMSLHTLALESTPIDVALSKSGTRLAVLSDQNLAVYALNLSKRPIPKPSLLWRCDVVKKHSPRHVTFVGNDQIFVLTDSWDENESYLWRSEEQMLSPRGPIVEAESISLLLSSVDHETLHAQFLNGALHQIGIDEATADLPPQTSLINKFPLPAPEVQVVEIEGQVCALSIHIVNIHLTVVDTSLWTDKERGVICERAHLGPKLHIVCGHHCPSDIHNDATSPQVCASRQCRW